MTEPSQYFKGRTVQEQMDEVIGYVDVRAAEVATTAIAGDVAQVHQDMLDADADASAAAASAAAAAGTLAVAVKKTGEASQNIAGDIAVAGTLSGGVVTGTQVTVPTPVNNTDAASKKYVDDHTIDTLDAYTPMVRTTDNQIIGATKLFTGVAGLASDSYEYQVRGDGDPHYLNSFYWFDRNQTPLGRIYLNVDHDGKTAIGYEVLNTDGTRKFGILAIGDVI